MRVRDVMSAPVHVIGPDAPAWEAAGMMRRLRIRRLPVMEGERLVGIVTWTDLVRAQPSAIGGHRYIPNLFVGVVVRRLMTAAPITVTPETLVEDAATLMRQKKIGGLPVIENGRLVGIITESDLFETLVDALRGPQEVWLHVHVASLRRDLPRVTTALSEAAIPVRAVRALRTGETEIVHVAVHGRDEKGAREALRGWPVTVDPTKPPEAVTAA